MNFDFDRLKLFNGLIKRFDIFCVYTLGYGDYFESKYDTQGRIQDGAFGANAPPPLQEIAYKIEIL